MLPLIAKGAILKTLEPLSCAKRAKNGRGGWWTERRKTWITPVFTTHKEKKTLILWIDNAIMVLSKYYS